MFSAKVPGIEDARRRLLKAIEYRDVVIVTRLDRLACSTLHLLPTVDAITKAGLSEFERSLIVSRTQTGILPGR